MCCFCSSIALTAHVLIGLEEVSPHLSGSHKAHVAAGKQRAVAYLERHLTAMGGNYNASYDLAITALALTLSGSSVADFAYGRLMKVTRYSDGMIYWSDREIATNRVRYEFNRPFLEAKDYQVRDFSPLNFLPLMYVAVLFCCLFPRYLYN